jgi:hypothetical protein
MHEERDISGRYKKKKDDASQYSVHDVPLNVYSISILLTCHADLE